MTKSNSFISSNQSVEPASLSNQVNVEDLNVTSARVGLLKSLWRGDAPLVVTYWLFGFVGSLIIYGVSSEIFSATSSKLAKISTLAFMVSYQVFVSVSIWRASKKYKGKRHYAVLAQTAVILGFFSSLPNVILALLVMITR